MKYTSIKTKDEITMSYYGGYGYGGGDGGGGGAEDLFVKAAVEVKRFLPSLFNIKVVRMSHIEDGESIKLTSSPHPPR